MYRVDRNNFYTTEKKATIYTPAQTSEYIFSLIDGNISKNSIIFDPCVGQGSLLLPFMRNDYVVLGMDIEDQGFENTRICNYLTVQEGDIVKPDLVIINPPFNIDEKTKTYVKQQYGSRPLLPEIWLMKTVELFGVDVPIILFTPYGLRLNITTQSKRWIRFMNGTYPEIMSIISLPKNLFDDILFHSEILIFNIAGLKPHYFCYQY